MIDKKKYLYWLEKDNPNLDLEVVYREMYSRIGFIFHNLQMNEYNIANILALEEFEKETGKAFTKDDIDRIKVKIDKKFNKLSKISFGELKKNIETSNYLSNIDMTLLEKIVDYRNYLAHRCFKEKLLNKELSTIDDADKFVEELNNFELVINNFNEWLLEIFKKNKIKRIWIEK